MKTSKVAIRSCQGMQSRTVCGLRRNISERSAQVNRRVPRTRRAARMHATRALLDIMSYHRKTDCLRARCERACTLIGSCERHSDKKCRPSQEPGEETHGAPR